MLETVSPYSFHVPIQVDLVANTEVKTQEVQWDPRTGFTVLAPNYDYASSPLCNASAGNITETRKLNIHVYDDSGKFVHKSV